MFFPVLPEIILVTQRHRWKPQLLSIHNFDVDVGGVFEVIGRPLAHLNDEIDHGRENEGHPEESA